MTSAALTDLATRIASNTLTVAQQAAFAEAFADILPTFPEPDQIASGIPNTEGALARAWIAVLYAIQSEGASGGSAVLPTNQTVWHINASTGSNSNDGLTSGTALASAAYLASLWRGTVGGGRPMLNPSSGSTITIFLDSDLPASDPISVLLDVDLVDGMTLIFVGAAKAASHTGTFNTASVYARTSAGGQEKVTDLGVADYSTFVGTASLVIDTTTGGVAWLYGPFPGPSATGICSRFYTPQTAGTASLPTVIDPAAADAYKLQPLTTVSLGNGFITRDFVGEGNPAPLVAFYRCEFRDTGETVTIASPTVIYAFQECQVDVTVRAVDAGQVIYINCLGFGNNYEAEGGTAVIECFAGALQAGTTGVGVFAGGDGEAIIDGDFCQCSDKGYAANANGILVLGNAARYCNGAAAGSLFDVDSGAACFVQPVAQGSEVVYGVDAVDCFTVGINASSLHFKTSAVGDFKSTHSVFTLGKSQTSSFGFDETSGLYVGPTTNTLAHVDAALGAGTGMGSNAVDPQTSSVVALAP